MLQIRPLLFSHLISLSDWHAALKDGKIEGHGNYGEKERIERRIRKRENKRHTQSKEIGKWENNKKERRREEERDTEKEIQKTEGERGRESALLNPMRGV